MKRIYACSNDPFTSTSESAETEPSPVLSVTKNGVTRNISSLYHLSQGDYFISNSGKIRKESVVLENDGSHARIASVVSNSPVIFVKKVSLDSGITGLNAIAQRTVTADFVAYDPKTFLGEADRNEYYNLRRKFEEVRP